MTTRVLRLATFPARSVAAGALARKRPETWEKRSAWGLMRLNGNEPAV